MQRPANRVALITGASGGLGRATALRFAQERARLCLADPVSCEGAGAGEGRGRHRNRCGPMSPWLTRGDGGGTGRLKIRVSAVTSIRIDVNPQVLTEVERALMAASGIPVSVLNSFLPRVAEAAGI